MTTGSHDGTNTATTIYECLPLTIVQYGILDYTIVLGTHYTSFLIVHHYCLLLSLNLTV